MRNAGPTVATPKNSSAPLSSRRWSKAHPFLLSRANTTSTPISHLAGVRSGSNGLAATVESVLVEDPFSGHVFVFRGRRDDIIKLLWWTGDGMCLLAKRLERGRFIWPQATSGTVNLTQAQLSMLLEGID